MEIITTANCLDAPLWLLIWTLVGKEVSRDESRDGYVNDRVWDMKQEWMIEELLFRKWKLKSNPTPLPIKNIGMTEYEINADLTL